MRRSSSNTGESEQPLADANRVRIVGYHRVADDPNPALLEWAVPVSMFDAQMCFLAESGHETITCSEMIRRLRIGASLDRAIVITFDDGYLDTVEVAAPIMAKYGQVATLFAVSGLLGRTAEWDARYGGEMAPLATAVQLRKLVEIGWEIGHHTISHAGLTRLTDEEILHEVLDGLDQLVSALGMPIETFAYPFSMQDERVRRVMVDTPFAGVFAAGSAWVTGRSPREAIPRVFVLGHHTVADLESLIATGNARSDQM